MIVIHILNVNRTHRQVMPQEITEARPENLYIGVFKKTFK